MEQDIPKAASTKRHGHTWQMMQPARSNRKSENKNKAEAGQKQPIQPPLPWIALKTSADETP
jgi:hypothetical protein